MSSLSISSESSILLAHESQQELKRNTIDFLGTKIDVPADNGATHSLTTEHLRQFNELSKTKTQFQQEIHNTWKDVASINGDTTSADESLTDTLEASEEVDVTDQEEGDSDAESKSLNEVLSEERTMQEPAEVAVQKDSSKDIYSHFDRASTQLNTLILKSREQSQALSEALTSLGTKIESLKSLSGVKQKTALFNLITEINNCLINPAFKKVQPPLQEMKQALTEAQKLIEDK